MKRIVSICAVIVICTFILGLSAFADSSPYPYVPSGTQFICAGYANGLDSEQTWYNSHAQNPSPYSLDMGGIIVEGVGLGVVSVFLTSCEYNGVAVTYNFVCKTFSQQSFALVLPYYVFDSVYEGSVTCNWVTPMEYVTRQSTVGILRNTSYTRLVWEDNLGSGNTYSSTQDYNCNGYRVEFTDVPADSEFTFYCTVSFVPGVSDIFTQAKSDYVHHIIEEGWDAIDILLSDVGQFRSVIYFVNIILDTPLVFTLLWVNVICMMMGIFIEFFRTA